MRGAQFILGEAELRLDVGDTWRNGHVHVPAPHPIAKYRTHNSQPAPLLG